MKLKLKASVIQNKPKPVLRFGAPPVAKKKGILVINTDQNEAAEREVAQVLKAKTRIEIFNPKSKPVEDVDNSGRGEAVKSAYDRDDFRVEFDSSKVKKGTVRCIELEGLDAEKIYGILFRKERTFSIWTTRSISGSELRRNWARLFDYDVIRFTSPDSNVPVWCRLLKLPNGLYVGLSPWRGQKHVVPQVGPLPRFKKVEKKEKVKYVQRKLSFTV